MKLLSHVMVLMLISGNAAAAEQPLAGWPGVFPELKGYACQFQAPVIGMDRTKVYRQTASYEWTGGDIRTLKVTLARAPELKATAPEKSEKVTIGKRTGWFKDGVLTLVLGEDRVIQLESGGSVAGRDGALALLTVFNLDRIAKALESSPRTDFRRSVEAFRAVTKGMSYRELTDWVGQPDADIGSGIHVMVYKLPAGERVLVGTPDFVKLAYIKHDDKDGKTEDLLK